MTNIPVHCIHCGELQSWEGAQWGIGPSSMRVDFSCHQCGWLVRAQAQTVEFMLAQMEAQ